MSNTERGTSYIGSLVREKRKALGLSQETLARACNMSTSHINKIEGTVEPNVSKERLRVLSIVLGFNCDEALLLSGKLPDVILAKAKESKRYIGVILELAQLSDAQLDALFDDGQGG